MAALQQEEAPYDTAALRRSLRAFRTSDNRRAALECLVTLGPLFILWTAMLVTATWSPWLALVFMPFAAGFLVRTFLIQHDCGHYAFFDRRWMNDWLGRVLGVVTFTPYEYWRRGHALHHAHSGNLDQRGFWDVPMLTVRQYQALGVPSRFGYRLIRHPIVLFGIAPIYLFLIQQRLPFGLMRKGAAPFLSTFGNNIALAVVIYGLGQLVGFGTLAFVGLPTLALTASIGVWLFFVQHYFEQTTFSSAPEWSFDEAALHGSSYYVLPQWMMWMTANIGIHHIHHLESRIPFYRLQEALGAHPELLEVGRLELAKSAFCIGRTLWDESQSVFVSP